MATRTVTNMQMLEKMDVNPNRVTQLNTLVAKIFKNRARYEVVQKALGVPWYVVGAIHYREASLNFNKHLHNGDPLDKRTTHVPKGRPTTGQPPFSWEESAIDALSDRKFEKAMAINPMMELMEGYNGMGYFKKGLPSPYLWSWTDQYEKGKYVEDGKFDPNFVDQQCGVMPLIIELKKLEVKLP